MLLCPLDYAFPLVDEKITKTYTNKYNSKSDVFNYVESNTNSFNNSLKVDDKEMNYLDLNPLHKEAYCPYCKKNNYSKFYKSNSIDLITISALSFLFFTIIKGK
jgi:hypothetical protein